MAADPKPTPKDLSGRLKALRDAADLSQQQLAEKAGLSWSIVSALEQGKTGNPRLGTLQALARVLGVRVAYLIGEEE